jgi:hypothetical protein
MARAKRHYLAGHTWHITHRCHKGEFLLKFAKDRRRYLQWLWEDRYHAPAVETDRHLLQGFVEKTRQELGIRAKGRKVVEAGPSYQLREPHKYLIWPILASITTILGLKTPISGMFIKKYQYDILARPQFQFR